MGLLIVALVGGGGYLLLNKVKDSQINGKAGEENKKQVTEREQCKERLKKFREAFELFKKDHNGAAPGKVLDLVPKYISNAAELTCPTADRWATLKKPLSQGSIQYDRRDFPMTYGFKFLTQGYDRLAKKLGDKTPVISCTSHSEATYKAGYGVTPPDGSFDEPSFSKLVSEVKASPNYAILMDGSIREDAK